MSVKFFDLEDDKNPLNGTVVSDSKSLLKILDGLASRTPFICRFDSDNGYELSIFVAEPMGSLQYALTSGLPPYLIPINKAVTRDETDFIEFLCGGTPTPVLKYNCLPFELIKDIAVHFQKTGGRSSMVDWEEV